MLSTKIFALTVSMLVHSAAFLIYWELTGPPRSSVHATSTAPTLTFITSESVYGVPASPGLDSESTHPSVHPIIHSSSDSVPEFAVPASAGLDSEFAHSSSDPSIHSPVEASPRLPLLASINGSPQASVSVSAAAHAIPDYRPPQYLSNPPPRYPESARQHHLEGTVLLLVSIDTQGRTIAATISKPSAHPILDSAALKTVSHWQFTPARLNGSPVVSQVEVPIRFHLSR